MATARDYCTTALRKIGVLGQGETLTGAQASDGLDALNRKIDEWALERLLIYSITRTTWTIVASDGEYSVGSGGDVDIARPIYIDRVGYIDTTTSPTTEYILPRLTDQAYQAITQKGLTSTYPTSWYYNPTFATGTLTYYPVPTSGDLQGVLYHPTAVSSLASLDTTVSVPPGYEQFYINDLALELCPEYERDPPAMVLRAATIAKQNIKRANVRMADLSFDRGVLGGSANSGYDIYSDTWR